MSAGRRAESGNWGSGRDVKGSVFFIHLEEGEALPGSLVTQTDKGSPGQFVLVI